MQHHPATGCEEADVMLQLRDGILGLTSKFEQLESQVQNKINSIEDNYTGLESKLKSN